MTPTIERDSEVWYVTLRCPDGVVRRIGPFSTASKAAAFAMLGIGGTSSHQWPGQASRPATTEGATTMINVRSLTEIRELKADWKSDPCWDIEDTDGFEAHRAELAAYRKECEARWVEERRERRVATSIRYACSLETADYILSLEYQLLTIEQRLAKLEG